jgi:nitrogen fixation NifU-like protein
MSEREEQSDFDRWVTVLQEAILEQQRAMFSPRVLAEASQPQNLAIMEDHDGYGLVFGSCGDVMEIFLKLDRDRIEEIAFMTNGCGPTVACGSMLTRMARGKSLADASAIEAAEVIVALDGLPAEHIHCATLAVDTLLEAIADCDPDEDGNGG